MRYKIPSIVVGTAIVAGVLMLWLFDVSLNLQFALTADTQQPDARQETLYRSCFAKRDTRIHERAFAEIDNPDVQREFIASERDAARTACRAEFPERWQTVRSPFRWNIFDFHRRN